MVEDAIVDVMNDGVCPEAPVSTWPHFILIGRGAFKTGAAVLQMDQRLEIVVFQVADVDPFVGRSLFYPLRAMAHSAWFAAAQLRCEATQR